MQKPGRASRGEAVLADQPAEPVAALSAVTLTAGEEADHRSARGRSEPESSVRAVAVVVPDEPQIEGRDPQVVDLERLVLSVSTDAAIRWEDDSEEWHAA